MSWEAVIVATARTPIGRAYRGAFNDTDATTLGGHVVAEAVRRAGVDPAEVEDVVFGCAVQQGATGQNIARFSALRAGLPNTVPGITGARCVGHLLHEGRRRGAKYGVVTMCTGGGMGAAGLFEIFS